MEELLQKHRTFTLSVVVGGFVFLVALFVRGCAVYQKDLGKARTQVESQARSLTASAVPDDKHLSELDARAKLALDRVATLADEVGRTARGDALLEECISDILASIGRKTPEKVGEYLSLAKRLPEVCLSKIVGEVRDVMLGRAAQADVEIAQDDLGFQGANFQAAEIDRNLAGLAVITRVVGRCIEAGVDRIETIAPGGSMKAAGGAENDPFLRAWLVKFKVRGGAQSLVDVLRSLNERDQDGRGRRVVLDEVPTLGRPPGVRTTDSATEEFLVRVLLVNLEAKEE